MPKYIVRDCKCCVNPIPLDCMALCISGYTPQQGTVKISGIGSIGPPVTSEDCNCSAQNDTYPVYLTSVSDTSYFWDFTDNTQGVGTNLVRTTTGGCTHDVSLLYREVDTPDCPFPSTIHTVFVQIQWGLRFGGSFNAPGDLEITVTLTEDGNDGTPSAGYRFYKVVDAAPLSTFHEETNAWYLTSCNISELLDLAGPADPADKTTGCGENATDPDPIPIQAQLDLS